MFLCICILEFHLAAELVGCKCLGLHSFLSELCVSFSFLLVGWSKMLTITLNFSPLFIPWFFSLFCWCLVFWHFSKFSFSHSAFLTCRLVFFLTYNFCSFFFFNNVILLPQLPKQLGLQSDAAGFILLLCKLFLSILCILSSFSFSRTFLDLYSALLTRFGTIQTSIRSGVLLWQIWLSCLGKDCGRTLKLWAKITH